MGYIGDFCYVISGQSPKGASYNDCGEGLEFHQGKKAFGDEIIEHSGVWTKEITKVAEAGDILMSVRAPVGPTNFTDRRVCIGRGLAAIRCKDNVLPKYVFYSLKRIEDAVVGKDGAVFNSINKKEIEKLPIPCLPLLEQGRIVGVLDAAFAKIDALKENAQKNLENAKALFQQVLKQELTPKPNWNFVKIKEIGSVRVGPFGSALHKSDYIEGGYPIINPIHYPKSIIVPDNKLTIREEKKEELSNYLLKKRDILFARRGEIGRNAIVEHDDNKLICGTGSLFVRFKDSCISKFLSVYFDSPEFKEILVSKASGATMLNISSKTIENIIVPLPQKAEQDLIITKIERQKKLLAKLEQNNIQVIAECDALKQAVLRRAFNGEL